eukprot:TRINITY_DN64406_c0_g1_i1.p1 TRINITY_DN64406_c0_g1~~TRINITY_DN64406_c0_g1_i1.p1  ORF type:complete len:197 (+),score=17.69 TRINITY_DN64406_c0_g1_i1:81-671(+)
MSSTTLVHGLVDARFGATSKIFYRTVSDLDVPPSNATLSALVQLVDKIPCHKFTGVGQNMWPTAREQTETRTLLIIRNIPCKVLKAYLKETLNALGYAGTYDFVNLPTKRNGKHGAESNVGYAFVNFMSPNVAYHFKREFEGYQFPGIRSGKRCSVEYANEQHGRGQGLSSSCMNPLSLRAPEPDEVPLVTKWTFQ